jgi:hypothetical protein
VRRADADTKILQNKARIVKVRNGFLPGGKNPYSSLLVVF